MINKDKVIYFKTGSTKGARHLSRIVRAMNAEPRDEAVRLYVLPGFHQMDVIREVNQDIESLNKLLAWTGSSPLNVERHY
jgi:hypothetical protein